MSDSEPISAPKSDTVCDVTVLGGGLAGKAAALHLAKAGLEVICIEPVETVRPPVGESLDWSAPELLKALGLPMEHLISEQAATWKRHVVVKMRDGSSADYIPTPWLGGAPFYIELRTLHVDRVRLDQELAKMVDGQNVTLVRDKIVRWNAREKGFYRSTPPGGGFPLPGLSTLPGSLAACWGASSTYPPFNMGPRRWRCGPITRFPTRLTEPRFTWIPCPRNTWTGFGKSLSILRPSASDTSRPVRE